MAIPREDAFIAAAIGKGLLIVEAVYLGDAEINSLICCVC